MPGIKLIKKLKYLLRPKNFYTLIIIKLQHIIRAPAPLTRPVRPILNTMFHCHILFSKRFRDAALHTLTGRNIQGVLLRPVNVYRAASLNRLQFGGGTKSRCDSFVAYLSRDQILNQIVGLFTRTAGDSP